MKIQQQKSGILIADSPAKINLFLLVRGKRKDGFHELLTVMQKIDLYDRLILKKREEGISCRMSFPGVPENKNIAFLAAKAFFEKAGIPGGVDIDIVKSVPAGGGLGGGSSNAACVLQCLNLFYGRPFLPAELQMLGGSLGSDVPFFLRPGTWIMRGRGETFVRRIRSARLYYLLFFFPLKSDTKAVYGNWQNKKAQKRQPLISYAQALEKKQAAFLRRKSSNDLLDPFLKTYPQQQQIYIDLRKKMCNNLFLSGSGSTFFSVFESKIKLKTAYCRLDDSLKKYVVQSKSF